MILLRLIFSFFNIRSLLLPYAYGSIESIDSILLLLFELKAILLVTSVLKSCAFEISLLFCMNFVLSSLRLFTLTFFFFKYFISLSI